MPIERVPLEEAEEARVAQGPSLGQSKPLVARYVAEHLAFGEDGAGWQRVRDLAQKLRLLTLASAPASASSDT